MELRRPAHPVGVAGVGEVTPKIQAWAVYRKDFPFKFKTLIEGVLALVWMENHSR